MMKETIAYHFTNCADIQLDSNAEVKYSFNNEQMEAFIDSVAESNPKKLVNCLTCNGRGKYYSDIIDKDRFVTCSNCEGKGKIELK